MTPADSLIITAVALDIRWADRQANLASAASAIASLAEKPDVVVLPELFSTGFVADEPLLRSLAETPDGPTLSALRGLAAAHDCAIAGSYAGCDTPDGPIYNRGFFLTPDGQVIFTDKRHLFCLSAEAGLFEPKQNEPRVVAFRGCRFAMSVCYDLRYPVWMRRRPGYEYDCMLVPANWPSARAYAWQHLLIARAIENQAYVVGANRAGHDDYGDYSRLSHIYDPMGQPIGSEAESAGTEVCVARISPGEVAKCRKRMPAEESADSFSVDYAKSL